MSKKSLLILIIACNAAKTIQSVVSRIPQSLITDYETDILIIDDSSQDDTFGCARSINELDTRSFSVHVLLTPEKLGYGGNQKIGFHYAIENGFDFIALLYGDGQYAPEYLPALMEPLADGTADMVLASRMSGGFQALIKGMPFYKFFGNMILTFLQNWLLRTNLSEYHSGYRIYSVSALKNIPFELNTNALHFDTEIIIQFHYAGLQIAERLGPIYFKGKIGFINGFAYAWNCAWTTFKARAMDFSLGYDRKFDCRKKDSLNEHYHPKLNYVSPSTLALKIIKPHSRVLDIGCAGGHFGSRLRKHGCHVVGVDICPLPEGDELDAFYLLDLNRDRLPFNLADFDYVLLLDVIEHLLNPEDFVEKLRMAATFAPNTQFIVSVGNVAFLVMRLMLLIGHFHYGQKGILDITHTRLLTFSTLCALFEQGGFRIIRKCGIPAPFPLLFGDNRFSRILIRLNQFLIHIRKTIFSYQILLVLKPNPSMPYLLNCAHTATENRIDELERRRGGLT